MIRKNEISGPEKYIDVTATYTKNWNETLVTWVHCYAGCNTVFRNNYGENTEILFQVLFSFPFLFYMQKA